MDKQKQIEKMATDLVKGEYYASNECMGTDCRDCEHRSKGSIKCRRMYQAEYLYNAGYRKIEEGAVVLTKEEYDELQKGVKTYNYTAMFDAQNSYRWEQGYLHARKETAEKFAERLKGLFPINEDVFRFTIPEKIHNAVDEICKELVEGKK